MSSTNGTRVTFKKGYKVEKGWGWILKEFWGGVGVGIQLKYIISIHHILKELIRY